MSKTYDHIVVIDVEATCWQDRPPPGEESEIIEIGVCLLHVPSGERGARDSLLVRPERSRVSDFCTQLTTLTQAQVDSGVTFKEACATLRKKHGTKDRPFASFGDYDRAQFQRQCQAAGIGLPFSSSHINVKALVAATLGLPSEVGMAEALRRLHLPLEGTHHRGGDDAWNIALILSRLLLAGRRSMGQGGQTG